MVKYVITAQPPRGKRKVVISGFTKKSNATIIKNKWISRGITPKGYKNFRVKKIS